MSLFNRPETDKLFDKFANGFTKDQKSAILSFASIVIFADAPMNPKEETELKNILHLLRVNEDNIEEEAPFIKSWDVIAYILNSFTDSHKSWLINTIHNLMLSDGDLNDKELVVAGKMFEEIGIDTKRYFDEVKKAKLLLEHFLKK